MTPPPVLFKSMAFESAPAAAGPSAGVPLALATVGARLAAGAIDLVGGAVLMVLVAASAGTIETEHGFAFLLEGAAAWAWLALVLLTSFLAEALCDGRTLGKAALSLRVVRAADGGRPSARALAIRTLLRVVDGFPCFYALGILLVVVSPDRQRLGDLAARTVVVRDRP